jgi:phytoene dehydrogenase-like protein
MGEIDGVFRAWGFAKGGTGAISEAIASSARALGVDIRTEARVHHVAMRNGQVTGVVLESGDEFNAKVVISSLDPKLTFLRLVDPRDLPIELVEAVGNFDTYGSSGKVNLALDALPDLACLPGNGPHLRGAISISPSLDYIERAYDQAKYGQFSEHPYIDVVIPSMIDPHMAPPGKHVMSCFVQYAPYQLAEGDWPTQREAFGDAVVNTLGAYIPNIKDIILHRQVLSPWDIEQSIGMSGGNIFQGELSLSQLFFLRPAPGYADYRTPIRGYYQCGSAVHPGGGITGAPGRLAALEILKDGKR